MKKSNTVLCFLSLFVMSCSIDSISDTQISHNNERDIKKNMSVKNVSELKIKNFNYSSENGPKPSKDHLEFHPDSSPELNMVTNPELRKKFMGDLPFPPRFSKSEGFSIKTCCGTGKLHWGARIANISSPTNNQWGAYAGHKVNLSQSLPDNDSLVYSPTMMPPNYTPLEVTTIYYRPPGVTTTQRVFGVWDHTRTSSQWRVYQDMTNTTWQNKYTANFTDGRFYFAQILKTSSSSKTFTVKLYNFQTSTWEDLSPFPETFGTNVSAQSSGWDFHEPKFDDLCPNLDTIKVSGLQVWNGSTWYNNDTSHGSSLISGTLTCTNWNKVMINDHYNWKIN